MEKKKNNAVEKVENTAKNNKGKMNSKKNSAKKASVQKRAKERLKKQKRLERDKKREERKIHASEKRAEMERIRAERKLEQSRIKAHKKAEKEKAKATALREKNRKKEQRKARAQEIKAERQKRKDMLKKETKTQKAKRIADEKRKKAELKRQKHLAKQEERAKRHENKQRNKENRKGFGGWLAAVISLGVATLVLASVLTFTFLMPRANDTMLETSYQRAFYDTVMQVDNMDLNLSKALATKDQSALQKYLVDLAINSELAENDIQELPLQDESKFYTAKLINQIGDYAKYLNKKLIDGKNLSSEEYQTLKRLYESNLTLKNTLKAMMDEMGEDYSFVDMANGDDALVVENLGELQNLSVEYPELIYDGPFSDGADRREVKGLSGEEISASGALQKFNSVFAGYNLGEAENVGMAEGNIVCYNVQAEADGELLFAQISKVGGKVIMFSYAGSCQSKEIEQDAGIEIAEEFLKGLGIDGMEAVWVNLANNVYTINFAYEQAGVTVYADLIKVRVCAETGKVIGLEASEYYHNHTEREIGKATLTSEKASAYVSSDIDIETNRLALVPVGEKTEKLCYEFMGNIGGDTYYVYIDAENGKQVEMFKVVNGTEGTLLM